ncbi:MAG: hypothetical protein ABI444_05230 [Candidatus Kapaibacterium sp.]|jgi:hypothetical protein
MSIKQRFIPIISILALLGSAACQKQPSNVLFGTWNVRSASGDTSIHTEPMLGYEVWASTFAQGGAMTFDPNDSLTIKMPPDGTLHSVAYSVIPNENKLIIRAASARRDTVSFKIVADTLWLDNPSRRTSIVLTKG